MGDEAAGFNGEDKAMWNLSAPALEYGFARKPVEAVVDSNGIKVPEEVLQPLWRLHIFRIKNAMRPMLVVPAAGSNVRLSHESGVARQVQKS